MSSRFDRSYLKLTTAYALLHDPEWLRPGPIDAAANRDELFAQQRETRRLARSEFGRYRQPARSERWVAPIAWSPGSTSWRARSLAVIGAALIWVAITSVAYLATRWTR